MLKYRGGALVRAGFITVILMALIVSVGFNTDGIRSWATELRYQALFAEAGGAVVGDAVTVAGIKVGSVSAVALDNGAARVTMTVAGSVRLGNQTTAHIRTGSLLGERVVVLEPAGGGKLRPTDVIPRSRTSSPYTLTEAVSDLTSNTAATDTTSLNQALDSLSSVIDQISPQIGPTFDGLTGLSRVLNGRNESLAQLFAHASEVTGILADRSQQLNSLILNGDQLLEVLVERRRAIVDLLARTSALARELTQLVADNEQELAPTLKRLNDVSAMLEKNRDNIAKALPGLAKYQLTQGEIVSNGFYYNAFVPNLIPAQVLQPFLDYAFGFRRGTNAGQPPDNAGPRAELPLPFNGIPGGSR